MGVLDWSTRNSSNAIKTQCFWLGIFANNVATSCGNFLKLSSASIAINRRYEG